MTRSAALPLAGVLVLVVSTFTSGERPVDKELGIQRTPTHQSPCWQKAFTQDAMNGCATEDLQDADAKMNAVYENVTRKYAGEPEKLAAIRVAQTAWLSFRDAEVDALFQASERPAGGSGWLMCRPLHLAQLTKERTEALRTYLEYTEGDLCSQEPPGIE